MGVALPVVAIASTVIGTAISAYGAYESGVQGKALAGYQAQVANNNATIAKQNADYATEAGNSKAQIQDLQTRALIASETAAQGSSGLDVNSGSAVDVRRGSAAMGTLSELNIRNDAAREAYGFQQQGVNYTAEGQLDQYKGANAMRAGEISAIGSIVGGAAKTYDMVSNFQRTGAFMQNPPDVVR